MMRGAEEAVDIRLSTAVRYIMDEHITRRKSRQVKVRGILIGGNAPISIQSMTKTDTRDVGATCSEIERLEKAGCEIIRMAIPDEEAARAVAKIRSKTDMPLVADIHFNYRLGLMALDAGVDKIRINPGNTPERGLKELASACLKYRVPVRIGVNSGSVSKDLIAKHGGRSAFALVESAVISARLLEDMGLSDIVISLKASDPLTTIQAYREMAKIADYPLHLGLTEAGSPWAGAIKSSVALGVLLADGIGDTIRVSLTGDPVEEVRVGREILRALKLRKGGVEIISCPTCGRCRVGLRFLSEVAQEVDKRTGHLEVPLKVAIMGCEVNGPGEAQEADVGLAIGKGRGLLFVKGKPVRQMAQEEFIPVLLNEISKLAGGHMVSNTDGNGESR